MVWCRNDMHERIEFAKRARKEALNKSKRATIEEGQAMRDTMPGRVGDNLGQIPNPDGLYVT